MSITYDRKSFFEAVRANIFGGWMTASQVAGTETMLVAWERFQPLGDIRFVAYALATAKWETASTMQPIEEIGHGRGRAYGVPAGPWHQVYDGRGDVQLTWLANYQKATARLRALGALTATEDLARTPALAMRPDIAAAIMVYGMQEAWFTGKKLADYFHGSVTDYVGARRIINGTDHAADIATIAENMFAALKASAVYSNAPRASVPPVPLAPSPSLTPAAPVVAPPVPKPSGLLARIATFFGRH